MGRKVLFIFLAICVCIFVVSFDRWGQTAFFRIVLSAFKPSMDDYSKTRSRTKIKPEQDFSDNFRIGCSSSAYQIEGAWNEDGKSPSIWDNFVHFYPNAIDDNSTADVSVDSYHNYKKDVEALKLVGVIYQQKQRFDDALQIFLYLKFQHYRFSISWTRILPSGSTINPRGIEYYENLIDELIANDIEPMITIFHWDVPSWLQDLGGLANPLFVDYFKAYADVLFKHYGSKVKKWITVNEPYNYCTVGYESDTWAPAIKSSGVGEYLCGHHLLLAHATAFHLYKEKYFDKQQGSVGITLDSRYYYAKNSSVSKADLHRAQLYRLGWFAHPLFSDDGGYPKIMVDEIGAKSKLEGRAFSRLPEMSDEVKAFVRGSSDFFGFNYYTSRLLYVDRSKHNVSEEPAWRKDSKSLIFTNTSWPCAKSDWLFSVPHGLRDLLKWIKQEYNNPPVLITENGWSDNGELEDNGRIDYFKSHLKAVSRAIKEDGCNVIGYTAWSLLDSFEWNRGYIEKFGIFSVNMTSHRKERTAKKSAGYLRKLIKTKIIE